MASKELNDFQLVPHTVRSVEQKPNEYTPIGVRMVNADLMWRIIGKGEGATVGIIDTGADYKHPDLKANIVDGRDFTGKGDFMDGNGHGTHVTGTVAASDSGSGIVGVAPEADVLALKALSDQGTGRMQWTISALEYAIEQEVDVINMSLGGRHLPQMHALIKKATDKGITVVAASGNSGDGLVFTREFSFPGAYEETIQVGAIDFYGQLAHFSNTNPGVDVRAPGVNILSTYKDGQYARLDGTSMASPHVAGIAALLKSARKEGNDG